MIVVSLLVGGFNCVHAVEQPSVSGVLGLETEDGSGWMAIRVDVLESDALSGILWYNNDASVHFSTIRVGTGFEDGPAAIGECLEVANNVTGQSSDWSECTFSQPVASSLGGLYVVFEFPEGSGFVDQGFGGGAAIGYGLGYTEPLGWVSGDGDCWHPLTNDYGLAVVPTFVPYTEGMAIKSLGDSNEEPSDIPESFYTRFGPNPFNPQLVVRFGLPVASRTRVDVFDVKGRRVKQLVDRHLTAGHHQMIWAGDDHSGRRAASGVYFVRVVSGEMDTTERVTMVK